MDLIESILIIFATRGKLDFMWSLLTFITILLFTTASGGLMLLPALLLAFLAYRWGYRSGYSAGSGIVDKSG